MDTDSELLEAFAQRAERLDVLVRLLLGRWPDLVEQAGPADVGMWFTTSLISDRLSPP